MPGTVRATSATARACSIISSRLLPLNLDGDRGDVAVREDARDEPAGPLEKFHARVLVA